MREIKFRIWDYENYLYFGIANDIFKYVEGGYFTDEYVIENTEQFTGLQDINGEEIYEGDMLFDSSGFKYMVSYNNDGCRFELTGIENYIGSTSINCDKIIDCKLEIIGNIHEKKRI